MTNTIAPADERFYNVDQSWVYERFVRIGPKRLRIKVVRNAYDMQSFGTVQMWSGHAWNEIDHMRSPMLSCCGNHMHERGDGKGMFERVNVSYTDDVLDDDQKGYFRADAGRLLDRAVEVIAP